MENLRLLRIKEGVQLLGLVVNSDQDTNYVMIKGVLNVMGTKIVKIESNGKLSDLTEAEKKMPVPPDPDKVRNIPIMNLPDDAIMSSSSVSEALDKVWIISSGLVDTSILVSPKSVYGTFYQATIEELLSNREVGSKIFRNSDLTDEVARSIYNTELAKKVFNLPG